MTNRGPIMSTILSNVYRRLTYADLSAQSCEWKYNESDGLGFYLKLHSRFLL